MTAARPSRSGPAGRLLTLALCVGVGLSGSAPLRALAEGEQAPAIEGVGVDGAAVDSTDSEAVATIVLFWRPGGRARNRVCELEKLARRHPDTRLLTVVSGSHPASAIREAIETCERPPTVVLDPDRAHYAAFGIIALPTVMVLDKERRLRFRAAGGSREGFAHVGEALDRLHGRVKPKKPDEKPAADLAALRRFRMAEKLLQAHADGPAKKVLEALTVERPDFRPAWVLLGYLAVRMQDVDMAASRLETAQRLDPGAPDVAAGMAWVWEQRGDPEQAAQWKNRIPEDDPHAVRIAASKPPFRTPED